MTSRATELLYYYDDNDGYFILILLNIKIIIIIITINVISSVNVNIYTHDIYDMIMIIVRILASECGLSSYLHVFFSFSIIIYLFELPIQSFDWHLIINYILNEKNTLQHNDLCPFYSRLLRTSFIERADYGNRKFACEMTISSGDDTAYAANEKS